MRLHCMESALREAISIDAKSTERSRNPIFEAADSKSFSVSVRCVCPFEHPSTPDDVFVYRFRGPSFVLYHSNPS